MFVLQKSDKQIIFNRILFGLYFHDVKYQYILMVSTTIGNLEGYTDL